MQAGDTFLLASGRVPTLHLWVILWGPAGPADAYLAVMLTTLRPYSDKACTLTAGDHPFIRHDTAVAYREVQRFTEEKLQHLIGNGTAKPRQPLDRAILERIRAGFFTSAYTPYALVSIAEGEFGAVRPAK